jgi:hypothetical protein
MSRKLQLFVVGCCAVLAALNVGRASIELVAGITGPYGPGNERLAPAVHEPAAVLGAEPAREASAGSSEGPSLPEPWNEEDGLRRAGV